MKTTNVKLENAKVNYKKGAVEAKSDAAQDLIELYENGLLEDGVKDFFLAEHELTKAFPKLAKNACSSKLIHAFKLHLN